MVSIALMGPTGYIFILMMLFMPWDWYNNAVKVMFYCEYELNKKGT